MYFLLYQFSFAGPTHIPRSVELPAHQIDPKPSSRKYYGKKKNESKRYNRVPTTARPRI